VVSLMDIALPKRSVGASLGSPKTGLGK